MNINMYESDDSCPQPEEKVLGQLGINGMSRTTHVYKSVKRKLNEYE